MNNLPPNLPPDAPRVRKQSALAVTSLVLGILALTCFSLLAGIPAVICGHLARGRIARSQGALRGSGLALAGLITGYVSFLFLPIMLAMFIPALSKAKERAVTITCMNNLREVEFAIRRWALDNKKEANDPVTLSDLQLYLKGTVFCRAGGTTLEDSYSVSTVGELPVCIAPQGGPQHRHQLVR